MEGWGDGMKAAMKNRLKTWLLIACVCLGLHDLMIVLAQIVIHGGFSWTECWKIAVSRLTQPGDATRYLDIARNGYTAEGENAINLVFYPLYPLLIRLLGYLTGNLPLSGVIISQAGYCIASVLLYELILLDGDARMAWDGVLLMTLYPFSMFAMGLFTEGLFLALTIGCLYGLRKGEFIAAGVIGFFASLTRTQGMLLIFPAVYEIVSRRLEKEKRKIKISDVSVLLIPAGFSVYLFINYLLHGNWFQFLIYEADAPWYQSTRWIGDNIAQHYSMALSNSGLAWIIYWVQIALYFGILFVLFYGLKRKERMMYLLYGGAYLGFTYLSGWMISGGRYGLGCVPIFIILSKLRDGTARRFLFFIAGMLFFVYSLFYLQGFAIM